jgi:5-methylcytosine-specific restriction endonuclease McrA
MRRGTKYHAQRKACRAEVIRRALGRCQRCGVGVSDDVPEWHSRRAHVNETTPRSQGGDPTDPDVCELLCQACHMPNGHHAPTAARMRTTPFFGKD